MALYLGLMSGTSLDGVDVALVELGGREERPRPARLVAWTVLPYDRAFRERLRKACREGGADAAGICALDAELGHRFADAVVAALGTWKVEAGRIRAVGSHGQTVRHAPPACTLQLGQSAVVAERTGLPVVSDFRAADLAAGGEGAPLTPYFDRLLLGDGEPGGGGRTRAVLNLGGMANLTVLPPDATGVEPVALDTGPGVALLDEAYRRLVAGDAPGEASAPFDRDGETAARGGVLSEALDEWREDPFFRRPPPRSTGRERFGPERLGVWLERHAEAAPEDLLATLAELTAWSVADGLARTGLKPEELYLCGGGARNLELVRRLRARLSGVEVRGLQALGWHPDAREAAAFALLARQHLLGWPASAPWATGASGPRILGKLTPAGGRVPGDYPVLARSPAGGGGG